jgi:hypothetical protein
MGAVVFPLALSVVGSEFAALILAPAMFAPVTIVLIAALALAGSSVRAEVLRRVLKNLAMALGGALLPSTALLLILAMRH